MNQLFRIINYMARYFYSIGLLVLSNVYYFWWNETSASLLCLFLFLALILFCLYRFKLDKSKLILIASAIVLFFYVSMPGPLGVFTFPVLNFLGIILVCITPANVFKTWVHGFFGLVAILSLPSIFIYLTLLSSIEFPFSVYYPESGEKAWESQFYRIYPGSVFMEHLIYSFRGITLARLQAIFDEPGFLGTISALYLVANSYSLKSWRNKLFLFLGLASLSLAFYFLSFVYLLARGVLKKEYKAIFVLFTIVCILIFVLIKIDISDVPLLSRLALGLEEFGNINNRTGTGFERAMKAFLAGSSSDILWGMGNAAHTQLQAGSSSIKALFFNYGVLGCFLIFCFYLIVFLKFLARNRIRESFVFILMFFISALQRPDLLSPVYFSIFVYGLIQARSNHEFTVSKHDSRFL